MEKLEGRIITENPLRILGVYSDTPKKEIVANLGKLRAFAKTGKTLSFDSDFTSLLGPVNRSLETIEKANNDISLPKDKLQAGMFWFMQHTDNDKLAMERLKAGDPNTAMTIMQKKSNYSGVVNMAVLALVSKKWDIALYSYAYLLESPLRRGALIKAFTDTEDFFSEDDLVDFISGKLVNDFPSAHWIEQLQHENVELGEKIYPFKSRFVNSKLLNKIEHKCIESIKKVIDEVLDKASSVSRTNANANLSMAAYVEEECKSLLKELRFALGKEHSVYIDYADNVSNQILDNCIDYYTHDADNPKRANSVIKYTRFAYRTAESKTTKERARKNLDILNKTLENLIPDSIEEEFCAIDNLITNYHKKKAIVNNTYLLGPIIEEAYQLLVSIKSKVGKDNKHYLSISSNFVFFAFQEVVKRINADSHYESNSERTAFVTNLQWARSIFDTLTKFDKDEECQEAFYKNFNTLIVLTRKMAVTPNPTTTSTRPVNRSANSTSKPINSNGGKYNNTGTISDNESQNPNISSILYVLLGIAFVAGIIILIIWGNKTKHSSEEVPQSESVYENQSISENSSTTNDYTSLDNQSTYENYTTNDYSSDETKTSSSYSNNIPIEAKVDELVNIVQFKTGDRPYQSTYGRGNYDSETQNSLLIKNGSSTDAVVFLERTNGKKIRHVFISRGQNFTMTNVPGGQYIIKVMQGTDWNTEKDNGVGNPKGGFMHSCSMSKSESYDAFDYPYPSSGQYCQYEVTLYKVHNGNMQTESINENDLF